MNQELIRAVQAAQAKALFAYNSAREHAYSAREKITEAWNLVSDADAVRAAIFGVARVLEAEKEAEEVAAWDAAVKADAARAAAVKAEVTARSRPSV